MVTSSIATPQKRLEGAAKTYLHMQYSVIPVFGDARPQQTKVAAIAWKAYQQRRATASDFAHWFNRCGYQGLAIVTGRISNLVVLDFDDANLAQSFATQYPHLAETRIVKSAGRGLPHYYFHLPPHLQITSQRAQGVDLQSDGRYVLAPPTSIAGKPYRVVRGGQPKTLTNTDIRHIEAFLAAQVSTSHDAPENVSNSQIDIVAPESTQVPRLDTVPVGTVEAQLLYQSQAQQVGRNEALFQIGLQLRDAGWRLRDVLNCLVDTHANQVSAQKHPRETIAQRRAEAQRTLQSVFSRPTQKPKSDDTSNFKGLPNSLREHFVQRKQTAVVRVLDGLLALGVKAKSLITEKQICELLKNRVGRHSILQALKAILPDKTPIFEISANDPSPRPPSHTHVATANADNSNNKCLLFRATKPDKIQRGRKAKQFVIPDARVLCARLGLKHTASDAIDPDAISSVKTYRQALQESLIKRRPGIYSQHWLAKRLGISRRTNQRYMQHEAIKQRPMFTAKHIQWQNLTSLPNADVPLDGTFLQDEKGKRYPVNAQLAKKLLKQKRIVYYMRQTANYFWHIDSEVERGTHIPEPIRTAPELPQTRFEVLPVYEAIDRSESAEIGSEAKKPQRKQAAQQKSTPQPHMRQPQRKLYQPKAKKYYRQALADEANEQMAQRLFKAIKTRCAGKSGYLSQPVARRLVEEYGLNLTKRVINLLKWRQNIHNPAGFVIVWLRSESKAYPLRL